MEHKEDKKDDALRRDIKKKVMPIFDKFLKEAKQNRMSVGRGRFKDEEYCFYQLHNLRLYFDFSKDGFSLFPKEETDVTRSVVTTARNNGHEKSFRNFMDCEIVVKKRQVEVRNYIDYKKWHRVFMGRAWEDFQDIWIRKVIESIDILKEFIVLYGGASRFEWLNEFSEDKVAGEDMIDLIPLKMRFHNEVAKKVYKERNVEFKTPAHASTYLTQRSQEDFVLKELSGVKAGFDDALNRLQVDALEPLREQIQLHLVVQKKTLSVQEENLVLLKELRESLVSPLDAVKARIKTFDDVFLLSDDIRGLGVSDRLLLSEWLLTENYKY